jgi:hypothetical protein
LIFANVLEEHAALIFRVGKLFWYGDGDNMFLQNSGPFLPDNSMWHHITVASTLNKYRHAPVSTDSVYAVSVISGSLQPPKNNGKLKK